jgi:hypothetical protein
MNTKLFTMILTIILAFLSTGVDGQTMGNGKVIALTRDLPFFNAIEAGGAINLTLIQSDRHQVIIETDENLVEMVETRVSNGTLRLNASGIRKPTKLELTVLFKDLNLLDISGAVKVKSEGPLSSEMLTLKSSGASTVYLDLVADKLQTILSGASKMTLTGSADNHLIDLSGATKLVAGSLQTITTTVNASGASDALINAKEMLTINTSGVAKVRYDKEPARIEVKNQLASAPMPPKPPVAPQLPSAPSGPGNDTVSLTIGNVKIKVIEGDSTVVEVGDRKLVVNEKGRVALMRNKQRKFNGHWSGIDLGLNGFLTPDYSLNMPSDYLDLRLEKSVVVNLNFYEQNIPLNKNRTFGIVSGLGLTWNNYRFVDNVMLREENKMITGYFIDGVGMKKSKLVNTYLTLPLFFELQTNSSKPKEKAHIAFGIVGGWRFSSHTKLYFLESNKSYTLKDQNGIVQPGSWVTPAASRRNIVKDYNSFQQNPFKLDAGIRAGWGLVNLFANYSLTPLFIKDRGPELYPFAVGITLNSF